MDKILNSVLWIILVVHVGMILVGVWWVWRGKYLVDRLVAFEVVSTLTLAIMVLIAIIRQDAFFIDIAIGLAALSAISTIALAKYIVDQRIF
jgi:multisubunit Na+/H+ antiporter MnhF subunit